MGRRLDRITVRFLAAVLGGATLAGCTAAPPPPLVTTPAAESPTNRPVNTGEVVVGVGNMAGGFNPHKVGDQSTVTTALATMLLPSVFRPAPDGTPRLDTTLMISADVTRADPYTVDYQIRQDASWADNAPIAAEDFVYLWQQLRGAPDAVDGAGYRMVSNISSRDAGKTVEVTFAKPYPGWRSLWSGLVPAHLLKDAPGGWTNALKDGFPTTGGPFAIKTLDRDRGEIVLERNDRYWEQPSTLDRIILRRTDERDAVDALRAGNDQLALIKADSAGAGLLDGVGGLTTVPSVPGSTVATLVLRPVGPNLSVEGVRRAIVAMIDRNSLITAGTDGGPAAALRADAQVLGPSAPGYTASIPSGPPATPDRDLGAQLLIEAGYAKTDGVWSRNGVPMNLVIAAPVERDSYVRIANDLLRQFTVMGIQAKVVTAPGNDLIATQLAATTPPAGGQLADIVVAPRAVGGDPATVMATNFGCVAKSDGSAQVPTITTGSCDPSLQPTIDAAISGAIPLSDALSAVEPAVWHEAVSVPLYQESDTLAVRPEMSGVSAGPPLVGPFAGAPEWRRSAN